MSFLFDPSTGLLVVAGLMVLMFVNVGIIIYESRWKPSVFRFEREVLSTSGLAPGPLATLTLFALPLDGSDRHVLTTFLASSMMLFLVQMLFCMAWWRLRGFRRSEQALLKAAAG